jgi:hypothetical protein
MPALPRRAWSGWSGAAIVPVEKAVAGAVVGHL